MKHIFCIILSLSLFSGCTDSSRPKDLPQLHPCTLTFTQDGKPLDGAVIALVPTGETVGKYQASTVTNAAGKAAFSTYGFSGVPAGRYKVTVKKNIESDLEYGKDDYGDQIVIGGTTYRLVEPKYSSAETTPFEIDIPLTKSTTLSFDTGKAVKIKAE
jgi:hypothetical protein